MATDPTFFNRKPLTNTQTSRCPLHWNNPRFLVTNMILSTKLFTNLRFEITPYYYYVKLASIWRILHYFSFVLCIIYVGSRLDDNTYQVLSIINTKVKMKKEKHDGLCQLQWHWKAFQCLHLLTCFLTIFSSPILADIQFELYSSPIWEQTHSVLCYELCSSPIMANIINDIWLTHFKWMLIFELFISKCKTDVK